MWCVFIAIIVLLGLFIYLFNLFAADQFSCSLTLRVLSFSLHFWDEERMSHSFFQARLKLYMFPVIQFKFKLGKTLSTVTELM